MITTETLKARIALTTPRIRTLLEDTSQRLLCALDALNDADDVVDALRAIALKRPSHAALDALEAAEVMQRAAKAEYDAANVADVWLNDTLYIAAGAFEASPAKQRAALVTLEVL